MATVAVCPSAPPAGLPRSPSLHLPTWPPGPDPVPRAGHTTLLWVCSSREALWGVGTQPLRPFHLGWGVGAELGCSSMSDRHPQRVRELCGRMPREGCLLPPFSLPGALGSYLRGQRGPGGPCVPGPPPACHVLPSLPPPAGPLGDSQATNVVPRLYQCHVLGDPCTLGHVPDSAQESVQGEGRGPSINVPSWPGCKHGTGRVP